MKRRIQVPIGPYLLVAAFALLAGCRSEAEPQIDAGAMARQAAATLLRGQPDAARKLVERARKADPHEPAMHIVSSCLYLEQGDLDDAARELDLAHRLIGTPDEVRLLEVLVARRREFGAEGWVSSALAAWQAVGKPDFDESELLSAVDSVDFVSAAAARAQSTPEAQLLWLVGTNERRCEKEELAQRFVGSGPSAAIRRVALGALSHPDPGCENIEGKIAVQILARQLAALDPNDGYMAGLAVVAGIAEDVPLTDEDLAALEAALERRRFDMGLATLFDTFIESYASAPRSLGPAFSAAVAVMPTRLGALVGKRARVTIVERPELKPRLVALMDVLGRRISQGPSILEVILGLVARIDATEFAGNDERTSKMNALLDRRREELTRANHVNDQLSRLPLPSLHAAILYRTTHDEARMVREFSDAAQKR